MKKITQTVDGVQYRRIPTFKEKVHNEMMKELFTGVEGHSNGIDIEVYEESKSRSVITMTLKEDALKKYKKMDDKMKIEGKDLFE